MMTLNEHWDAIFSNKKDSELGWYESDLSQTLKFLDFIPNISEASVFIAGVGTSQLLDVLLQKSSFLIVNDISEKALQRSVERIGVNEGKIFLLNHDISKPLPSTIPHSDVWVDRAVLHFLIEESHIDTYFQNLWLNVKVGGYVLFAEFALEGSPMCAGLKLHRYSVDELSKRIGPHFNLICEEKYTFINPFGDPRPYIYALYKRKDFFYEHNN